MLATQCAVYFNLAPQSEDESDVTFKSRISGALRSMGKIIEAHEAHNDRFYDQSSDVFSGIAGALALAMAGRRFSGDSIKPFDGEKQVGDDICCGVLLNNAKPEMTPEMAVLIVALLGAR